MGSGRGFRELGPGLHALDPNKLRRLWPLEASLTLGVCILEFRFGIPPSVVPNEIPVQPPIFCILDASVQYKKLPCSLSRNQGALLPLGSDPASQGRGKRGP